LVYNQAGLALFWHFVTTAGVMTETAVTPTTGGGDYDWTDQGDSGCYSVGMPDTGGASINNDSEGYGWFTGVATGVLPWRGPIIVFRAAGLNNLLVNNAFSATRALASTALPDDVSHEAGGLPISDAGGLDLDTLLAYLDATISSRGTADPGDLMGLVADAITSSKFDESTAFPVKSADSGSTEIARTGADGDTLETLSDEIAVVDGNVDAMKLIIDLLEGSAGTILNGTAQTGTLSTTEMTTDLTITVNDQLNGRVIIFKSDTTTTGLRFQATDITDCVTTDGKLTFTAITNAPVNGDTFIII